MAFKLAAIEDLFPEKAAADKKKEKELNFGQMFKLDFEKKKDIVKYINDCVEECKKQRVEIIEKKKRAIRNYEGIKLSSGPWEGSSNISTMVTTIACDMMHAKLFPMVWNPDLMHFIGREKHDDTVAENNRVFMHWALTRDMEETQDKADEIVQRFVIDGIINIKIRWETYRTYITRSKPESVDDRGEIKYTIVYDEVKRERARWEVKDFDRVYFPVNAVNVREAPYIIEEGFFTYPMLIEMNALGLFLPDFDTDALKNQLGNFLKPEGMRETRNQALGVTEYADRPDSYPIKVYEGYIRYDINGDGIGEECVFITIPDLNIYACGKPLHCVSKTGTRPWIIKPFLRRPGSMIGKGIPEIIEHLHNEMDAIHNQRIDAGNMVIAPFFFFRPASGFDPKKISIRPATGIPLDDPQRDVVFPNYNASRLTVSFEEEKIIMQLIQMLTNVTDPMLGRETANRPTARGTLAIIAQGDQRFTPLAARVVKAMAELITLTRKFYEENISSEILNRVLGKDNKPPRIRLSPENIAGDYDCYQDIDLSNTNEALEKQVDQIMFQSMAQDPFVNQNPAYAWELRANYIRALGKKNVEKIIGPKPDYEMSPGDIQDENLLMWQETPVVVHPNDDHLAHVNSHAEFKRTMAQNLTPNALLMITTHLLEHRHMYQQKLQEMAMTSQGGQGAGQGTSGTPGTLSAPRMGTFQGPRVGAGQPGAAAPGQEMSPGGAEG